MMDFTPLGQVRIVGLEGSQPPGKRKVPTLTVDALQNAARRYRGRPSPSCQLTRFFRFLFFLVA
jgi:hypothetical protein